MAIESEVLVIGGGLAGTTAALAAADRGAGVRLVSDGESTLAQASGLIDVLGYAYRDGELDEEPLADPFDAIDSLPPDHPYDPLGPDAIRSGLDLFQTVVDGLYAGAHTDRNALVATPAGTMKPTARYPESVRPGLLSRTEDALLIGFDGVPGLDAPLVAERLASLGVPFAVDGVDVSFPAEFPADASTLRYADALDRDDPVTDADGSTREVLAERVRPHLDGHDRVGFPPLLGRDHHGAVRDELGDRLGVPAFELPGTPPSLHGLRLSDRLDGALTEAGVDVSVGNRVVDAETDEDGIGRVFVDREGQRIPHAAESYVLATGGLVSRGVDSDRKGVREPLFDCHVPHPRDRSSWYRDDPFEDHPFARFGVRIDERARPLDDRGDPEYENLVAAGGVVGGADPAREKSASGISLATGVVAGREAATGVGQ